MVLDVLVQSRRDKGAAKRLLRKLLKRQCRTPRVIIADKLASYGVAQKEIMPGVEYRQHKGLNNRAENSHPDFYTAAPRDQDGRANVILSLMTAFGPIGTRRGFGRFKLRKVILSRQTLRRKSSKTWIVSCSPGHRR